MSANVPIVPIIEPPQFSRRMEHRVFEPAQPADGGGEVSGGISGCRFASGMPFKVAGCHLKARQLYPDSRQTLYKQSLHHPSAQGYIQVRRHNLAQAGAYRD